MPVIFTSVYGAVAHGALNWDAQLRTDIGNLGGLLNGAISLGSGANLNGYNFQGRYIGFSMTNTPQGLADTFLVDVIAAVDGTAAVQIAHRMTSGSLSSWRRYYVNGVGWSAWAAV